MLDTDLYKRDTLPNTIAFRPNYSLVKVDSSNIQLSFFDTIPETIGNPRELYTYDTSKLDSHRFIFLTNLAEYGIIRNNGKDVYLRKDHQKCLNLIDGRYKDVYSGNGFQVTCITKTVKQGNGESYEIGFLEIKNSRYQTTIKIHGGYKI